MQTYNTQVFIVNGYRAFHSKGGMPEDLDDKDAFTDPGKCASPITNKKEFKAHMR